VKNKVRSGRTRLTTQRIDVIICQEFKKDRRRSAVKYSAEIKETMGFQISPSIRRRFNDADMRCRISRKKQWISDKIKRNVCQEICYRDQLKPGTTSIGLMRVNSTFSGLMVWFEYGEKLGES